MCVHRSAPETARATRAERRKKGPQPRARIPSARARPRNGVVPGRIPGPLINAGGPPRAFFVALAQIATSTEPPKIDETFQVCRPPNFNARVRAKAVKRPRARARTRARRAKNAPPPPPRSACRAARRDSGSRRRRGEPQYIKGNTKFFAVALRGGGGPFAIVEHWTSLGAWRPAAPSSAGTGLGPRLRLQPVPRAHHRVVLRRHDHQGARGARPGRQGARGAGSLLARLPCARARARVRASVARARSHALLRPLALFGLRRACARANPSAGPTRASPSTGGRPTAREPLARPARPRPQGHAAALQPDDEQRLASISADLTMKVWDIEKRAQISRGDVQGEHLLQERRGGTTSAAVRGELKGQVRAHLRRAAAPPRRAPRARGARGREEHEELTFLGRLNNLVTVGARRARGAVAAPRARSRSLRAQARASARSLDGPRPGRRRLRACGFVRRAIEREREGANERRTTRGRARAQCSSGYS